MKSMCKPYDGLGGWRMATDRMDLMLRIDLKKHEQRERNADVNRGSMMNSREEQSK